MPELAKRTASLRQSDIRAISLLLRETGGINLGQGICDMPTPEPIREAAIEAVDASRSIYSHYAGIQKLRAGIAEKARTYNGLPVSSDEEVMVSVGSTGAFVAAVLTLFDAGDEVILIEPFYGYHRNLLEILGVQIRYVKSVAPDWAIDLDAIEAAVTPRTKAIVVNTPGNPSGKVWTRDELTGLQQLLEKHDMVALTDEIYEYMLYDGREHVSLGALPGAWERTVTISGFSKTYNMTGWRLGYAIGPESLLAPMGLISDLIYICAPTPLQHGVSAAFDMPGSYFENMASDYAQKRSMLCDALSDAGFLIHKPEGSYYVLADFSPLAERFEGFSDDQEASRTMVHRAGVGSVAGRSFFENAEDRRHYLRFCFAKEFDELERACKQIREAFQPDAG